MLALWISLPWVVFIVLALAVLILFIYQKRKAAKANAIPAVAHQSVS